MEAKEHTIKKMTPNEKYFLLSEANKETDVFKVTFKTAYGNELEIISRFLGSVHGGGYMFEKLTIQSERIINIQKINK